MNKLKLLITCFGSVLLFVGCGDSTKVTGTSEETNELAIELSSSSTIPEEKSSSSKDVSSSSSKKSSSSVKSSSSIAPSSSSVAESSSDKQEKSSSSSKGNTSTKSCSSQQIPSSSSAIVSSSSVIRSSTSDGDLSPARPNSLKRYLVQFGIDSVQFDNAVMASTTIESEKPGSADTNPPTMWASEFGTVGLHPFVKDNINALETLFPETAVEYADLVTAIKNGNNECGLYLMNIYGDEQTIGHIAIDIQPDSITVLDIVANKCKQTTNGQLVGFLFSYCGEMERYPKLARIPIEVDIPLNKCPSLDEKKEWVKENSEP